MQPCSRRSCSKNSWRTKHAREALSGRKSKRLSSKISLRNSESRRTSSVSVSTYLNGQLFNKYPWIVCLLVWADLIIYLRLYLMMHYKGPDFKRLIASLPVSPIYESFVLSFAAKLLKYLRVKYMIHLATLLSCL